MEAIKKQFVTGDMSLAEALKEIDALETKRQQQLIRADELIAVELERRRQGRDDSKALPKVG
jgi:Tfp pilus assembly protein PilN